MVGVIHATASLSYAPARRMSVVLLMPVNLQPLPLASYQHNLQQLKVMII